MEWTLGVQYFFSSTALTVFVEMFTVFSVNQLPISCFDWLISLFFSNNFEEFVCNPFKGGSVISIAAIVSTPGVRIET